MSDPVLITLITSLATLLAALANIVVTYLNARAGKERGEQSAERGQRIEKALDGVLKDKTAVERADAAQGAVTDERAKVATKAADHAEGVASEKERAALMK